MKLSILRQIRHQISFLVLRLVLAIGIIALENEAQSATAMECAVKRETLAELCCPNVNSMGKRPAFKPVGATTERFQYRNCKTGKIRTIQCNRGGRPREDVIFEEPAKNLTIQLSNVCKDLLQNFEQEDCGSVPFTICRVEQEEAGPFTIHPQCEALEEFQSSSPRGNVCHSFPFSYFDSILANRPGIFSNGNPSTDSNSLQYQPLPEDKTSRPDQQEDSVTNLIPQDQINIPAIPFRLEVPSDFVRFFATRAGLVNALKAISNPAAGITCDQDGPSCSINQLKFLNVESALKRLSYDTPNFSITTAPTSDGFDITGLSWGADTSIRGAEGKLSVKWRGKIRIRPHNGLTAEIDFRRNTNLAFLPLHDPGLANGYDSGLSYIEKKGLFLDRALILRGLPSDKCRKLRDAIIPGAKDLYGNPIGFNRTYLTYRQPYACHCSPDGDTNKNYCVTDPYPRALMVPEFAPSALATLPNKVETREATCTNPIWINTEIASSSNDRIHRSTLESAYSFPGFPIERLRADILSLGCSGQRTQVVTLGHHVAGPTPSNPRWVSGRWTTSGTGVQLETLLRLGGLEAEFDRGVGLGFVWIELGFFAEIEQWLMSRWYSWLSGWFLKWTMKLLSAVLSLLVSVTIHLVGDNPAVPNSAYVESDDLRLILHGVITNEDLENGGQQLSFGLRRISTNKPNHSKTGFDFKFDAPACDFSAASVMDGPAEFLTFFLKTGGLCPYQAFTETVEFILSPLSQFFISIADLLGGVLNALNVKLNTAVFSNTDQIETNSALGKVFADSIRSVMITPNHFLEKNHPLRDLRELHDMAPMLSTLCTMGENPQVTCLMGKLAHFKAARLGAKSYFRTGQKNSSPNLSTGEPHVRDCYSQDIPNGNPALYANALQCAMFADLESKGSIMTRNFEIKTVPTARTSLLMNEALSCRDVHNCDPTRADSKIRKKADLAMCSLAADFWFKELPSDSLTDPPYRNLMLMGTNTNIQAVLHEIKSAAEPDFDPSWTAVRDYLRSCHRKLAGANLIPSDRFPYSPPLLVPMPTHNLIKGNASMRYWLDLE